MGRAHEWGDARFGPVPARAALWAPPPADLQSVGGSTAAGRGLRSHHGRNGRGPRGRSLARRAPRTGTVRSRRGRSGRVPRRRRDRVQLPGDAPPGGERALRGRRRSGRRPGAADAPGDRQRLRADGPDRTRRLGDGRAPSPGHTGAEAAPGAALPRACRGDRAVTTVRTIADLREALATREGAIGLIPTMGAFHEGHLSLIRAAREENDTVVVSLFVNPAQFDDEPDLAAYPRDEARDAALATEAGVDILFAPPAEELYPPGYQTWVEVEELGSILEGRFRPGHFRGVATVCLKLFNLVRPRRAYFGQKDAQQAAVVRCLVRDLNVPVEIRVLPTVRDEDGLALSSRNAHLSPDERERALALPRALATRDPAKARALLDGLEVDYLEVAEFEPKVLAAAVRVGNTRLIDNVVLEDVGSGLSLTPPTEEGDGT